MRAVPHLRKFILPSSTSQGMFRPVCFSGAVTFSGQHLSTLLKQVFAEAGTGVYVPFLQSESHNQRTESYYAQTCYELFHEKWKSYDSRY